ncbi:MAG TPA: aminotransferase class I/II-fold pyridoxal phosphate-dependent enzyme [Thermoanaerobaculia bacterium]|nr:aminotransferase class I/II-fold pyridoxal phosphate-dependent enzyme [Thermoanaerobaculia bacterium]
MAGASDPPFARGTRAARGGEPRTRADHAVTQPIVCTATYSFSGRAEMEDHFEGRVERLEYGRYGNPTVRAAERKIAALDGAEDAVLFGSGMAAVTTALLAMTRSGQHVVLTNDCYRRTRQLVTSFLSRFGVESTLVPPGDLAALSAALLPGKTRLIVTESPTNPYLRVADLPACANVARRHPGVKLLVDSTFATPINQRPLELGADLVLHSGTKYLGGHNDLLAGSLSGKADLVAAIRDLRGVLGTVLDPHSAYLLLRGMKTLELRVLRQNASAQRIAGWLAVHPLVERVFYPGLPDHPDHAVAAAQMTGFGGVVSFVVKGGLDAAARLVDGVRLPLIAPSLGGVESLIEQPALMSFYELTTEERRAIGIEEGLVRLSVGIEDADDLIADLERALSGAGEIELPGKSL